MSIQNCCVNSEIDAISSDIKANLASRLEDAYSHKEILSYGKVAYLDSYGYEKDGIYNHFLYKNALDFVDLYSDFAGLDLAKYCALILPMSVDEVELWRHRNKIYDFLDNGGGGISFCHNYTGILPNNAGYIQSPVEIRDREVKLTSHAITQGVREYDINFRRGVKGFFNRGYFEIFEQLGVCHTEPLGEVSQSNKNRDISVSAKPQYDKEIQSQYDNVISPSFADGDKGGGYKPFEIFLRDSEDKCVGYIDRISTQGTILATAGTDLLTYGVFENNSARRLGLNLLKWLGEELKAKTECQKWRTSQSIIASERGKRGNPLVEQSGRFHFDKHIIASQTSPNPLRKNPKLKNAIITGGASYERNFFYNKDAKYAHFFDERIYHKDALVADFSGLDYIVLASRANPRFLLPCKEKFLDFLQKGGSIVSFGEITQGYLPNIAWKEYGVNFWWWLSQGADMSFEIGEYGQSLFSKMELFTAKWHYHGAFYPPKDSQMILANELGEAIIYKDISHKGGLYVTSLDPDFHLGQGFMPKTEPFFDNFMEWVEEDILDSRM